MDNTKKCPVCGIKQIDGNFKFSYLNKIVSDEEVYSKVCRHTKKNGCINSSEIYNKDLDYKPFPGDN